MISETPTRTVTVAVTQEDIAEGARCSSRRCPIARALLRAFPEADEASVSPFTFGMYRGLSPLAEARLPLVARHFVHSFDRHEEVEPFSFEVEVA